MPNQRPKTAVFFSLLLLVSSTLSGLSHATAPVSAEPQNACGDKPYQILKSPKLFTTGSPSIIVKGCKETTITILGRHIKDKSTLSGEKIGEWYASVDANQAARLRLPTKTLRPGATYSAEIYADDELVDVVYFMMMSW